MFRWNELEFRKSNEECVICFSTEYKQVKFPTNCGHWFCIDCARNILIWNEERYHLSPESYGCLPCPNKCINPIQGKQCYCEEYDKVIEDWKKKSIDDYIEWNNAENLSIELSEKNPENIYGSRICPLCRKKYLISYVEKNI